MCEQRSVKSEHAEEGLLQVQIKEEEIPAEVAAEEILEVKREIAAEILHTKVEIARLERSSKKVKVAAAAKTSLPLRFSNDKRPHVGDLPAAERRAMKGESSEGHVMKKEEVDDQAVPRAVAKYLEDHVMKKEEDDDQADTNFYYLEVAFFIIKLSLINI